MDKYQQINRNKTIFLNMIYKYAFFEQNIIMKTVKGTSFFDKQSTKIKQYPYINQDMGCDILIVGGGIEGATLNFYLSKARNCILVDANRLGTGSTSIATALLEFQLDDFASDLKTLSKEEIVEVYKIGKQSLIEIENFLNTYGNHCHHARKSTFLYSNRLRDIKKLKDEFVFRKQNGFDCQFFDQTTNPFGFEIKAGIYDTNGGAEFDPYMFEKQMIENASNQNSIFENTKIVKIRQNGKKVFCYTNYGNVIVANKVIVATGFDTELLDDYAKELMKMQISYSIVTERIKDLYLYDKALLQDCLDNYHYLRVLPDNRIIFGGEDTKFGKKIDEKTAIKKYNSLLTELAKLLGYKAEQIEVEFAFCGLFASTDNNLGIVGESKNKNIMYFLSCGANGIINTFCGVKIIEDILCGRKNNMEKLFSPLRGLKK